MNLSPLCFYTRLGVCVNCDTKFPTCIVTGRPLLDYQFWMCSTCKHRAYENDIRTMSTCPLCHAEIWTQLFHLVYTLNIPLLWVTLLYITSKMKMQGHLIYDEFWWRYLLLFKLNTKVPKSPCDYKHCLMNFRKQFCSNKQALMAWQLVKHCDHNTLHNKE